MCYRATCVDASTVVSNINITANPCIPNPCKNGGICVQNITTSSLFCKCPYGKNFSGNSISYKKQLKYL